MGRIQRKSGLSPELVERCEVAAEIEDDEELLAAVAQVLESWAQSRR